MTSLIILCAAVFLFLLLVAQQQFKSRLSVESGRQERQVVINGLTGALKVLHPGTHYMNPWWRKLSTVDINREPVTSEPLQTKTKEGVFYTAEVRYDMVAGREFKKENGRLVGYDPNKGKFLGELEKTDGRVTDEDVILAVTAMDFEDRTAYTKSIVSAAVDRVIGEYTADELSLPAEFQRKVPLFNHDELLAREVSSTKELYERLGLYIEYLVNENLRHVGINVLSLQVTNLQPTDAKLQQAYEARVRARQLARASAQLEAEAGLTPLVSMAVALDQPLGQVALADAVKSAAQDLGEGLKKFGQG